jgi:hypothetical protein
MKQFVVFSAGILLCAGFWGCGINFKNEKKTESLTYRFQENGCDTGTVNYANDEDYCEALKNDSRNNFCASGMRYQAFRAKKCAGIFR